MNERRDFLGKALGVLAAGYAASSLPRLATASEASAAHAPTPLNILMIGGTGFLGSHHANAALERGHRVTVMSRNSRERNAKLPPGVKTIVADRYVDLSAIKNQSWDVVIDFAAYAPLGVRLLGQALQGRVKHYTLISTISRYAWTGGEKDETSPPLDYADPTDPYTLKGPKDYSQYCSLKALCEREAEAQFPHKTLTIRPGVVVGPNATQDFLAFWFARMEKGGEILVPGDPLDRVQLIDARDIAQWVIRMVEQGETGTYNTTGPMGALTQSELLGAVRSQFSSSTQLTWAPSRWMIEQKIPVKTTPLFWMKEPQFAQRDEYWASYRVSSRKAFAKGLVLRPLASTLADNLASFKAIPRERQTPFESGWDAQLEQKTLALWQAARR